MYLLCFFADPAIPFLDLDWADAVPIMVQPVGRVPKVAPIILPLSRKTKAPAAVADAPAAKVPRIVKEPKTGNYPRIDYPSFVEVSYDFFVAGLRHSNHGQSPMVMD